MNNYDAIINRLIKSMETPPAENWEKPWIDAEEIVSGRMQGNAIIINTRAEEVLNAYYKREKITYIEELQNRSFYAPDADFIVLPEHRQFHSSLAYYSVKAHETIHSTGDYTRCFREGFDEFKSVSFGNTKYTREELVAEIGAVLLLDALGIDTTEAEKSATIYLYHWRSKLNNNNKWIKEAGLLAQEAVDYILGRD